MPDEMRSATVVRPRPIEKRHKLEHNKSMGESTKPHKSPLTPRETQILTDYGVFDRLKRPRERILHWVVKIHEGIHATLAQDPTPLSLLDDMLASDLRLVIFYLEGILKLYRKRYPEIEKVFVSVKSLEDQLGALSAYIGFTVIARENKAPKKAIDYLVHEGEKARDTLLAKLEKEWMPKDKGCIPALQEIVDFLVATPFDKYKKDRKIVRAEIVRRLKKFEAIEFDMSQLQGDVSIHELRRQLRWFPIYATSLDGLFALSEDINPIKEFKKNLKSKLAQSKYSKLPSSERETNPYEISKSLFIANNAYISMLGKIKDRGEEIEAIEHALLGAKLETTVPKARARAIKILGLEQDAFEKVIDDARIIFEDIKEHRFAKRLRKDVERS